MSNTNAIPAAFAVYNADILPQAVFQKLMETASMERRKKAEKFHRREDSCRALVAEALTRYTLKKTGLAGRQELNFQTGRYGKPSIDKDGVHFNISHSGSWVVCVADVQEVGIDIEKIHKVDSGISERYFSAAENDMLIKCNSEDDRLCLFYKIWVLKESYIKAIGKGLSCSLGSFAALPQKNNNSQLILYDTALPCKFLKNYNVDPAYKCAICCSHQRLPENIRVISVEEIT